MQLEGFLLPQPVFAPPSALPFIQHGALKSSPEFTKPLLFGSTHVVNVHPNLSKVVWLSQNLTFSSQTLGPGSVEPAVFAGLSI